MDPISASLSALSQLLQPKILMLMVLASVFGIVVGAMPGLTATMAIALLVPITFALDPIAAFAVIVTATAMAIFAGDIPGVLMRIPGTPASAAYTDESFAMTKKGQGAFALGTCVTTSVIGGLFGTAVLMFAAPAIARVAVQFSSYEYLWLGLLGLTASVFVAGASVLKALIAMILGLLIGCIGIDVAVGYPRFTFGSSDLLDGVNFIPAMIGLFAFSEILRYALRGDGPQGRTYSANGPIFKGQGALLWKYRWNLLRGSSIGTFIGALPGAGADIAAWVTYGLGRKLSKEPEKFGTGHAEGLVDAGAANNAAISGAWIPALVFAIPGDSVTAIAIGILYMKGLTPGPQIFTQQAPLVYAIFWAFIIANLIMWPLAWIAIKASGRILRTPRNILMSIVFLFAMLGAYAINNSFFDVGVMLAFGVLGFVMEENKFPIAPVILGLVLGRMIEDHFMSSMMKASGQWLPFFDRPLAAALATATIIVWITLIWRGLSPLLKTRIAKAG
ncbi:MAG: tripartite tricarboxylate transporter permease [Beijerinckiaceae bacterium]|jgi:TctA family transporter|nr:tripartite tricarboxylate transporter permease [Beijerinckiaceae bacterium]